MLKCVEDSEDFKDSLRELKEQLESLKEADFFHADCQTGKD